MSKQLNMWRYIPGVKRPQTISTTTSSSSKRPQRSSSPVSSDDEFEIAEERRGYVLSWKNNYTWLDYNDGKMFCSLCRSNKKKNVFATSGSTNFRRSALTDHGKSLEHTEAVRASQQSNQAAPFFVSAIESADNAILTLLKAAYFIAKEDLAILKFRELLKLLERCLCPHLPRELYRNRDACHEFVTIIGEYLESELVNVIKDSAYLGIMVDESTDLSVRKNLVIYVNVLDSVGNLNSYFSQIAEMKECDAPALTEAIIEYLENKGIDISKVAGLGSDGAGVMVGRHNGVGAILKRLNPFMLSMHCVAHKLALASENAASAVSYCQQHNSVLRGLYNFFHTSPNHYSVLKSMMEILDDPVIHIQQVHTVRWLTMYKAVEAVRKCYSSLLSTLSTLGDNDVVAKGLYNSVRSYKFIVFTHFLCDILSTLTYLSCFFQQDNLDFSQVQSAVEGTITNIKETYLDSDSTVGGDNLTMILEHLQNPLIFEDHQLKKKSSDEQECFSTIRMFATTVVNNIEERFPNLPIWSSFKIFDPLSYPSKATELRVFGNDNMKILMNHFGQAKIVDGNEFPEIVNPSDFQREWPIFKRSVFDNYRGLSFKELAKEIITKRSTSFPTISKILKFIVVLPMSSVPCERGFSQHNRIRTKLRQQLTVQTVKSLMFVAVNGPDPEILDYTKPLQMWKNRRIRHIYSSTREKIIEV